MKLKRYLDHVDGCPCERCRGHRESPLRLSPVQLSRLWEVLRSELDIQVALQVYERIQMEV